ncbi:reverse transcriptase domain-containing protein [Tanacetum coccineum]
MHKKSDYFCLDQGAETAFQTMKEHIAKLPMLTAPEEQEELIVYLAASKEAVSAVLMTEREARQMPIYFEPEDEGQDNSAKEEEPLPARWTLFTDGSSCVDGCGAGVILTDPEGMGVHNHLFEISVETTNKRQTVNGTYIAKEADMIKYLEKVRTLTSTFRAFSIKQVPRSKNKKADALSKMASTSFAHLSKQVLVEDV